MNTRKREMRSSLTRSPDQSHSVRPTGNGLRRLPRDFSWQLLSVLLRGCSDSISVRAQHLISDVVRKRDAEGYYALDQLFGLQCIAEQKLGVVLGNQDVLYMLSSVFRKSTSIELKSRSLRRAECLEKVQTVDAGLPPFRKEWKSDRVYKSAARFLQDLLGPAPTDEDVAISSKHGPGSTATVAFGARSPYFKYESWPYGCGALARTLLTNCIISDTRWVSVLEDDYRDRLDIPKWAILNKEAFWASLVGSPASYNVITTVPKDGRKDRPIAKEQTGNVYLQLGVGQLLRRRLSLIGVDLDHQADKNRSRALRASRDSQSFTIDLSSASDTIGCDLVRSLLPADWFLLLNSLRAPWGVLPTGEAFLYRKFSSMGNGFTFELETILFLAICRGVSEVYGHVSDHFDVFGDDIIGPDYLYDHVKIYLEYSGFQVNSEKSFHGSQPVRESCGVDAFYGTNIRPVFIKGDPVDAMELIGIRNRLRGWFLSHLGEYPVCVDSFLLGWFIECPPFGPDSNVETEGWLQDGPWALGRRFCALTRRVRNVPARDLRFRKLMHSLRSCTGEGGNFLVAERSDRVKLVERVVYNQFDWLTD